MGTIPISFRDQAGLTGDLRPKVVLYDAGADKIWNHVSEAFVTPDAEFSEDDEAYLFATEHEFAVGRYAASFVNVVGDIPSAEIHLFNGQGDLVISPIRIVDGEQVSDIPPTESEIGDYLSTILPGSTAVNAWEVSTAKTFVVGKRRLGKLLAEEVITISKNARNVLLAFDFSSVVRQEFQVPGTARYSPNDGGLTITPLGPQPKARYVVSVSPTVAKDYVIELEVTTVRGELEVAQGRLNVGESLST